MLGGPAHVQVDVQAPVHHEAHRVNHVQQPLDGHDAGDVHQLPQVLVRALLLDLLDGRQARGVGGVELRGDDAVGDDDGASGVAAELIGLGDGPRVEVGGGVGVGVAQAPHLQPPGHPHALAPADVEGAVVGEPDVEVQPAFQKGVDGVAHVEVVLGQQHLGAVLAGGVDAQQHGVAGGVGVVDLGARDRLGQDRVGQGEEVAQAPEDVGHRHPQVRHHVVVGLHELARAQDRPDRVAARGAQALADEVPQRLGLAVLSQGEHRAQDAPGQLAALAAVHAQVARAGAQEVLLVLLHGQVEDLHPGDVVRHAVEVLEWRVGVPGDVDDPEGEVRVAGDDVVDHRGDPALEVGVGGLHDDGDIDVHVHAVLGDAIGQDLLISLGLGLLGEREQLGRAGGGLLVLVLGGLLGQGDGGRVGGGRGHGLPGDGGGGGSLLGLLGRGPDRLPRGRLGGGRGLRPVRLLRGRLGGDRGIAVHRGHGGLRGVGGLRGSSGCSGVGGQGGRGGRDGRVFGVNEWLRCGGAGGGRLHRRGCRGARGSRCGRAHGTEDRGVQGAGALRGGRLRALGAGLDHSVAGRRRGLDDAVDRHGRDLRSRDLRSGGRGRGRLGDRFGDGRVSRRDGGRACGGGGGRGPAQGAAGGDHDAVSVGADLDPGAGLLAPVADAGGVVGTGHRGVAAGGSRVTQRKALQAGAEGG